MFAIKEDCTAHGSQKGAALRELSDDGHTGNACPASHSVPWFLLISVSFLLRVQALCSSLCSPTQQSPGTLLSCRLSEFAHD